MTPKPGVYRKPEDTIQTITKQMKAACLGVQSVIEEIQTTTGVKDTLASFWIKQLIDKSREQQRIRISDPQTRDPRLQNIKLKGADRESVKNELKQAIQGELFCWVIQQPPESYSALPPGSGKSLL